MVSDQLDLEIKIVIRNMEMIVVSESSSMEFLNLKVNNIPNISDHGFIAGRLEGHSVNMNRTQKVTL